MLLIGHRGASAHAPENTLAAFRLAFEHGADGLEFDVQLARDRVPVVIHDDDLRRTGLTNEKVCELTSVELARVDVGTWFNRHHPKLAREEYAREPIPTLAQVFELCENEIRAKILYVELKCETDGTGRALAAETLKVLSRFPRLASRVRIESFHLDAIKESKRLAPEIRTAALFDRTLKRPHLSSRAIFAAAQTHAADELALHRSFITRRTVERATQQNFPVVVWTVDARVWARRGVDFGLHALITNHPARLRAALDEVRATLET